VGGLSQSRVDVIPEHHLGCSGIALHLGGRQILNDVSIEVGHGEIVGVAGPNGAGKTTLLDVLSGRHQNYRGTVTLDGTSLDRLGHPHRVRAGLARTYQHPLVPVNLTVGETFDAARKAFRPTASRMAAEWAAELCHLDVAASTPCGGLETLDRRKLLLACLLLRRPSFLLLDEPASGLVSSEIDELDRIIKRLAWELRIGVLIVEHRLELLEAICDRVVVLDVGEVIATGTADEVFSDPVVRRAYFGVDEATEAASDDPLGEADAVGAGATP
jgi:branched-chain amino acid transport system ATP-binding protein